MMSWLRKVLVVVPSFNEAENLPSLLASLRDLRNNNCLPLFVLVVDDASTDETPAKVTAFSALNPWVKMIRHQVNQGLGGALCTGFQEVLQDSSVDVVCTLDADNTMDVNSIPIMLEQIKHGNDLAIASRYAAGSQVQEVPIFRRIISRIGSYICRMVTGNRVVRDYSSGFRAYKAQVIRQAFNQWGDDFITSRNFDCQIEILFKVIHGCTKRVSEIPINLNYHNKLKSSHFRFWPTAKGYLKQVILFLILSWVFLLTFATNVFAYSTTISLTNLETRIYRYDGSTLGNWTSIGPSAGSIYAYLEYYNYWGYPCLRDSASYYSSLRATYNYSLPTNIYVTSTTLNYWGQNAEGYYSPNLYITFGNTSIISPPTAGWQTADVGWLNGVNGGSGSLSSVTNYMGHENPAYIGSWSWSTWIYGVGSGLTPYLTITYEYVPTIPTITSPVTAYSKDTVLLSASSSVVGNATLYYYWEYSLDSSTNWTPIGYTASTSYNWTYPASVPSGTKVYIRCYAVGNNVSSGISSPVTVINDYEPAVAAKIAALAAQANTTYGGKSVAQLVNDLDITPPLLRVNWYKDKSITTSSSEYLYLAVKDNKTMLSDLVYSITDTDGNTLVTWSNLPDSQKTLISLVKGLNSFIIYVKDAAGNISSAGAEIWKI